METIIREYLRDHMTVLQFESVRIDCLRPALPFYAHTIAEASPLNWTEGHTVRVAAVEGLSLTKLVAFRPQDLVDIEVLLITNRADVDVERIRQEVSTFLDADDPRWKWLEDAIARLVPQQMHNRGTA